ncbi:unnamed protein product, partial [Amoebophrya sp. A120]|eukprot:GSA120T00002444001.1
MLCVYFRMPFLIRLLLGVLWGRRHLVSAGAASSKSSSRGTNMLNNWAVILDSSRYFYNYRHASNALSFYHTVKRLGIPDSQIILMLAEDYACNPRNPFPGQIFNDQSKSLNLYSDEGDANSSSGPFQNRGQSRRTSDTKVDQLSQLQQDSSSSVEVDYRGDEVTVGNFLRLLTGKHPKWTPRNKRLLTNQQSNLLIYATGHSGAGFLKFQDWEELQSQDLADALHVMHQQKRYGKVFWISDTCQAASIQNDIYSPNVLALGSSRVGENSYSHHIDYDIGAAVIDRFTHDSLEFFNRALVPQNPQMHRVTIRDYLQALVPARLFSNPELRTDLMTRSPGVAAADPAGTALVEFFGNSPGGTTVETVPAGRWRLPRTPAGVRAMLWGSTSKGGTRKNSKGTVKDYNAAPGIAAVLRELEDAEKTAAGAKDDTLPSSNAAQAGARTTGVDQKPALVEDADASNMEKIIEEKNTNARTKATAVAVSVLVLLLTLESNLFWNQKQWIMGSTRDANLFRVACCY